MRKSTYKLIWASVQILLMIIPLSWAIFWTPYDISKDEHMVETVNKRAMEYEQPNGTVTDFTLSEIMDNDAKQEYEERVWKLEHREVYWFENIGFAFVMGSLMQLFNGVWAMIYTAPFKRWDDD